MNTDKAIVPSREQLIYWLHEAAEIEHNLMCCYLYAAFSLKRADARWTPSQAEAVKRWRGAITGVAMEEMTHLCLVANLVNALGAPPHFNRPMFPIDAGPYPSGFVMRLQPFSIDTIKHFQFLERSNDAEIADGAGFAPSRQYKRLTNLSERLSPGAHDYSTVGELYGTLRNALDAFVHAHGESALFIGDAAKQVDKKLAPLPGVTAITDLASAHQALDTIVTQGEGAGDEVHDSHFQRFIKIGEELNRLLADDPSFAPAWAAATNPVMNPPPTPANKVYINHPQQARWLDIGNAMYTSSLRCLLQGFDATDQAIKATWLEASFALMRATVPVGQGLAARPATEAENSPLAGLTFTSLRTLARLPGPNDAQFMADRLGELQARAKALPLNLVEGETSAMWQGVIDALALQKAKLTALQAAQLATRTLTQATAARQEVVTPAPVRVLGKTSSTSKVGDTATLPEIVDGKDVTIIFDSQRCIHARHCVLQTPTVFKANTPGQWIYPDTVNVESIVTVAQQCPSGAIRYARHDDGPEESAPAVNTLNVRENGPYALRAAIRLTAPNGSISDDGIRATLCRCGQSKRKPWCDGSHVAAQFVATGEPPTGDTNALDVRNGEIYVEPRLNGPLHIRGNLEICAGTGRTVARVTETRLCRCGQSNSKPFCDGSHIGAGFLAEGT
jgi:CDGSH-type Zn-finger protein/uncharacterized Fe-S cluster protein YjdI